MDKIRKPTASRGMQSLFSLRHAIILSVVLSIFYSACMLFLYIYGFRNAYQNEIYTTFDSLSQNIESQLEKNLQQIYELSRSISYSTTIQTYLLSPDKIEAIRAGAASEDIMSVYMTSNQMFSNIILLSDTQRSIYGNSVSIISAASGGETVSLRDYLWEEGSKLRRNEYSFTPVLFRTYGQQEIPYVFFLRMAGGILPETAYRSPRILCAVSCDLQKLLGIDNAWIPNDMALSIDDGDRILWSNREMPSHLQDAVYLQDRESGEICVDGDVYLFDTLYIPELSCRMIWTISKDAIDNISLSAFYKLFLVCLCGGGVLLIFMVVLLRALSDPLLTMQKELKELHKQPGRRLSVPHLHELGDLASGINQMLQRIEDANERENALRQRLYHAALLQNQTKLQFYRNQINPHFLFNTLECVRSMARHYGNVSIEQIVSSMAKIFRYSVYTGVVVPLESEIRHASDYFTVMDIRTANQCSFRISADKEARDYRVLSMLLQPLIENAFQHAFPCGKKRFQILLKAVVHPDGSLSLQITDNGRGIPSEKLESLLEQLRRTSTVQQSERHIGLLNIAQRLSLVFGSQASLHIRSQEGFYTQIEFIIPHPLPDNALEIPLRPSSQ